MYIMQLGPYLCAAGQTQGLKQGAVAEWLFYTRKHTRGFYAKTREKEEKEKKEKSKENK